MDGAFNKEGCEFESVANSNIYSNAISFFEKVVFSRSSCRSYCFPNMGTRYITVKKKRINFYLI